jgi:uncharacterized protein YPO0396
LAQVFWTPTTQGQPERFYAVADRALTIADDLADFGSEISGLRKRLRSSDVRVHDTFPPYGRDFRRVLGIDSDQAMELFHQTVSMKSVTDLNEFVRSHMLEPFDGESWIDRLVAHFEDLTRAHDAVLKARHQVEQLGPILTDCMAHEELTARIDSLEAQRASLRVFAAGRKAILLEELVARNAIDIQAAQDRVKHLESRIKELDGRREALTLERAGHGGDRLGWLEQQLRQQSQEKDRRRRQFDRMNDLLTEVGLPLIAERAQMAPLIARIAEGSAQLDAAAADADNRVTELSMEQREVKQHSEEINAELLSLHSRRSNLPRRSLELREELSAHLGIEAGDLPFAGELIQVRSEAAGWEGAAERLLRGFGLSILVPDQHYRAVAAWIDSRHLGMRLVYYRVPARLMAAGTLEPQRGDGERLYEKLQIGQDSPFYAWLERELRQRANLLCAATTEEFTRAAAAITRAGQIKTGQRHEKNDSRPIGDRSSYVLGWSNQNKIDALLDEASALHQRGQRLAATIQEAHRARSAVAARRTAFSKLDDYRSWDDLDWRSCVARISELDGERRALEKASGELARIAADLKAVESESESLRHEHTAEVQALGGLQRDRTQLCQSLRICREVLDAVDSPPPGILAELTRRATQVPLDSERAVDDWERETGEAILNELRNRRGRLGSLAEKIVGAMNRFRTAFPAETSDMDASVAASGEYRSLHDRLVSDDLPRFEGEFKSYLNTNTIRDVAGFQSELNRQVTLIRERIDRINESLFGIDYNQGRYIRLETQAAPSMEIRDFRAELRACIDDTLAGTSGDQYSERKFLQVKALIERFRGRVGQTEADKNWTRRVTDVRNWFIFIASERRREDDGEHESYTDSGGKSGGQKEKLAYTILAASLAYQFKLDWGVTRSKTFRFVVIDEAFGRGSDESTRFALTLFRRLGLQLMIVTPLQKIQVIEPFVSAVGFVDNRTGSYSRLQTLTIEEFRAQRATHDKQRNARALVEMEG